MTLVIVLRNNDYDFGMLEEDFELDNPDMRLVWLSIFEPAHIHKDNIFPFQRTSKFLGHSMWIKENETPS